MICRRIARYSLVSATTALLAFAGGLLISADAIHAAVRTWDGGGTPVGADFLWSDAFNWDGDVTAPVAGDSLVFGGTLGLQQLNDLAADTSFAGLTFSAGSSAFDLNGNRITLGGNIIDNATFAQAIRNDLVLSDNRTVSVRAGGAPLGGGSLVLSGVISDGGAAKGITLVNNSLTRLQVGAGGVFSFGNLTLRGASTYTGATTVQTGELVLDFGTTGAPISDIISGSSALVLGSLSPTTTPGAGSLLMSGRAGAINSQNFAGTTIGVGHNFIAATDSAGGASTLNLGAISRQTGGVVQFTLPAAGSIQATGTLNNGILGGWATVGSVGAPTDWATLSGGNVVALPVGSYAAAAGAGNITNPTFAATSNVRWTGIAAAAAIGAPATTTDLNTINFTDNTASTATISGTLRLGAQGGIFRSSTAGNTTQQLSGGTITAGGAPDTPGEINLVVNQQTGVDNNNNNLQINSAISDNGTGAVTLIKSGRGSLNLNAGNNYSGGTYITSGRVQMGNASAFGTGPVYITPGGHLFWNSGSNNNNYFVSGLGSVESAGNFGAIRFNNAGALAGTLTLTGDTRLTSSNAGSTVSGKITGNYDLEFGADLGTARTDTQVLTISNVSNDWTGTTTINRGTLRVGNNEVIPHGAGFGNVVFDSSGTRTNAGGAILDLRSRNETINGLSTTGSNQTNSHIANNVAGTGTLTVGANNASGSFAGNLVDGGGLGKLAITKTGTGTQSFSGVNFHSGGTTVEEGTLVFSGGVGVAQTAQNGTWANNATLITGLANTAGLLVGQRVTGTGIPANSYIAGINGATSININNNLTPAAGPVSLTFAAGGSALGTGPINVNAPGTLDVAGVTGGASLASGQTLTNNGIVIGGVTAGNGSTVKGTGRFNNTITLNGTSPTVGGTINPGNSAGTLTADSVTVGTGGVLAIEIDGAAADKLIVNNTAALAGSGVTVSILNPGTQPFYDIVMAGTLASMPVLNTAAIGRTNFSLSNPDANTIRLNVVGGPANVRWVGGDVANNPTRWESTQLDANWTTTDAVADTTHYYDGDFVTFNDNNNNNYNVDLSGTVAPGSVTVDNATFLYTIAGSGNIAGAGSLVKNGAGALTLANTTASTFSGGVTVNQGTVNINQAGVLGTGTLTLNNGVTIDNTSVTPVTVSTNNAQNWAGSFTYGGSFDLNLGTGAVTLNADPTLTVTASKLTVGGVIADGTGDSLTKEGAGTLVLTGANTYTGTTSVNSGTVQITNSTGLGTLTSPADVTIAAGGAVDLGLAATGAINFGTKEFRIAGAGVGGTGAITNSGQNTQLNAFNFITLTGDATIGGYRMDLGRGAGIDGVLDLQGFKLTIAMTPNAVTTPQPMMAVLGTADIVGDGTIEVASGALAFEASASALADNVVSITFKPGAHLQAFRQVKDLITAPMIFEGGNTIGGGTGTGLVGQIDSPITLKGHVNLQGLTSGNIPASPANNPIILAGDIGETGGSFSLQAVGNNTTTLAGNNTYSGGTTINSGATIQVGGQQADAAAQLPAGTSGTLGTGPVTNNGTLRFNRSNAYTAANDIGGSGVVQKIAAGTLTLSGNNSYTGTTTVSAGTLLVNGTHTAAGAYSVASGAALGGSGTIAPTVAVNAASGAIVAPGDGLGTLTFDGVGAGGPVLTMTAGSLFSYELNSSLQSDLIAMVNTAPGDIVFNSNAINFTDLSGGALAAGEYTLLTADAAGAYSGLTVGANDVITGGLSVGTGLAGYASAVLRAVGNNILLNVANLPGDYNANGTVDAADYVTWRKADGTGVTLANDLTPGVVDSTDYDLWRANFGKVFPGSGAGSVATQNAAVPEPSTAILTLLIIAGGWLTRGRRGA